MKTFGYAAQDATSALAPFHFERKDAGPQDVVIDILYCGICHSDIHQARNEWGNSNYPMVPGHEIVGRISAVGSEVSKFKIGDLGGVGCMLDSCRQCESCQAGEEQFCEKGAAFTYNGVYADGSPTYGGYSKQIVVHQDFALKISEKLDLAATAPLLCAGITTYSPLRHWKVSKGQRVGVIGLGGLGHMGLKFAHALGAHVTQFTTSPDKEADARRLGAHEVVNTRQEGALEGLAPFDFILDTVAAPHDVNPFLRLLRRDATMVLVGVPEVPLSVESFAVVAGRRSLSGSLIGGIRETQEMLDFCAEHSIVSDIELIPIQKVNEAYERTIRSDVKYRFVIDMNTLTENA
ncbi:NAD(P)-dependent alcohol dehydrogenase [bacterium]|nr:NAD(P)-dependent alcohol dehydrogenase [bacterium]